MQALDIVKLTSGDFSCEILANYGAALNSYKHNDFEFVEGYSNPEQIQSNKYKGVILAPFPNRVAKGIYTFQDKEYQLPINRAKEGLALHGFVYNKSFETVTQTTNSLTLEYLYQKELESFPFTFKLQVRYDLHKDGKLLVSTNVWNLSDIEMPFGLGWHPYFKIGESIEGLSLEFPASQQVLLNDKLIPNGEKQNFLLHNTEISLKGKQFDDCFLMSNLGQNDFILSDGLKSLRVYALAKSDFSFFQIYTPKDRKTIAIEPMTCEPNAFNSKQGLKVLSPQSHHSFTYGIQAS